LLERDVHVHLAEVKAPLMDRLQSTDGLDSKVRGVVSQYGMIAV